MIELSIGENINLTQEAPAVDSILVGMQWRTDEPLLRESVEAGVLLTNGGRLADRQDFVFSHQVLDRSKTVHHSTGEGEDATQFLVSLPGVPDNVDSLEMVLFINGTDMVKFNRASGVRVRVINPANGSTMVRTPLVELGRSSAVRLMQIYRHRGDWKLRAVCDEWPDIPAMLRGFGL